MFTLVLAGGGGNGPLVLPPCVRACICANASLSHLYKQSNIYDVMDMVKSLCAVASVIIIFLTYNYWYSESISKRLFESAAVTHSILPSENATCHIRKDPLRLSNASNDHFECVNTIKTECYPALKQW